MSQPTVYDEVKLKRVGRYLLGKPRLIYNFICQDPVGETEGYSDSD